MTEDKKKEIRVKIFTFIFFALFAIYIFVQDVRDNVKSFFYYINESSPIYVLLASAFLFSLFNFKKDKRLLDTILGSVIWGSFVTYALVPRVNEGVRSYLHSVSELSPILYPLAIVTLLSLLAWREYKKIKNIENSKEKAFPLFLMYIYLFVAALFSIGLIQGVYNAF